MFVFLLLKMMVNFKIPISKSKKCAHILLQDIVMFHVESARPEPGYPKPGFTPSNPNPGFTCDRPGFTIMPALLVIFAEILKEKLTKFEDIDR